MKTGQKVKWFDNDGFEGLRECRDKKILSEQEFYEAEKMCHHNGVIVSFHVIIENKRPYSYAVIKEKDQFVCQPLELLNIKR